MRKLLTALGLSVVLFNGIVADAKAPTIYRPLEDREFTPIVVTPIILDSIGEITRNRPKIKAVDPKPKVEVKSTSKPKVATKFSTSHSVFGTASWYCKAGVSVCHYAYPPGSMVAAACGKLRRAMGSNWRGKTVRVQSGGRSVTVKLVDWCGSTTKLIDLYWEPMRRLGGTGTLPVKVSW